MTAFISGPITKRLKTYQYAFADAQMVLEFLGYKVLNPAWLPKGLKDKDYETVNDAMLSVADAIVLLPGWEKSPGARREARLAEELRKQIMTYGQLDNLVEKKGIMGDAQH